MQKIVFLLCIFLGACQLETLTSTQLLQSSTPILQEENTWQELSLGLEQTRYQANSTTFYAVRINPQYFDFRVHYRPEVTLNIQEWREELPNAEVIVNANFFAPDNTILGLLVSDGQAYGRSYTDRGGTFFVQNGVVGIRSNLNQPYRGEAFDQAIQAFPMLVFNGTQAYTNERDKHISRRTIIGQDAAGRIIIIVTSTLGISLYDLSAFLAESDTELVHAFNLDGGGSSMWYVAASDSTILSFDPVPAVLAIYSKN